MSSSEVFSTGLFDCLKDTKLCVRGIFCTPCMSADYLAQTRQEDCTVWHCLAPAHPMWLRANIRKMKNAQPSYFNDFVAGCCCMCCSVCQVGRELSMKNQSLTQSLQ